jgi:hypothetical protein
MMLSDMLVEFVKSGKRLGYSVATVNRTKYAYFAVMDCALMTFQLVFARKCRVTIWVGTF